jgi:hypothetical protein
MLRILLSLVILTSCTIGAVKTGGQKRYAYNSNSEYSTTNLKEMSPEIVETSVKEPPAGKLADLFGKGQAPLKKLGIVIFETRIQPTYEGLAKKNMIYLSEAGKQIMTENLLRIWEQSIPVLEPEVEYVTTAKIKKAKSFHAYGRVEENYVKSKRSTLAPDDIFFLDSGKQTTTTSILNPRGMQDLSILLVPAGELMGGPKWSEQNKQFVNDVMKEMKLDAVIVLLSDISWTAAHTDKHSGELINEEVKIEINASTLVSLSSYHERLKNLKDSALPNVTLCYKSYETEMKIPAVISVPVENKNFETIEKELLTPVMKTYKDLAFMTIMRISEDIKKTW